ncbi:hypothetical protein AVEN_199801-1 [Araneus ventricosus]|uniref:Uncharacterized protein n=1 Tax=Araneus ventricosus TaxID=182803 RepID=A0A4Y2JCN7_ARAVE|nr:hypothetical protein AVEN_199801-1 [Araneus ventricosus]
MRECLGETTPAGFIDTPFQNAISRQYGLHNCRIQLMQTKGSILVPPVGLGMGSVVNVRDPTPNPTGGTRIEKESSHLPENERLNSIKKALLIDARLSLPYTTMCMMF